jgi:hypothetical protein
MPARKGDDFGYVLPLEIDPQRIRLCIEIPNEQNHIAAFWGALQELGHAYNWHNDEAHTAKLAAGVWQDVYRSARANFLFGDCLSDVPCQTYPMTSPRITWSPESPYLPQPEVPTGYLFHPFTVVNTGIIDSIISVWGLGYQVGDVYTDLTKLPTGDWGEIIDDGYLFFPRFRINDLNGTGTVKIHFLNIPQGGRALIVVDGVLDLLHLQLVELNKDGVSVPPETQTPLVIEVPIDIAGEHYIDVVFVPNVNDEIIPFFFGGGVRQIEICGFGLQGCDDMAGCCPEEISILRRIFNQNNTFMQYVFNIMDDGETPDSFVPDAPEGFTENTGDADAYARVRALCAAVTRYVHNVLRGLVESQAQTDLIGDILELLPPTGLIMGLVDGFYDIAQEAIAGLVGDQNAVDAVICHMVDNLTGQDNTQPIFRDSVQPNEFEAFSNEWQIALIVDIANASVANWRAFNGILPELYESISGGASVDCPCDCDDDVVLSDFAGTGCVITPVGDCIYKFYQPTGEDIGGGTIIYRFSFRDDLGRCLLIENTGDPLRPTRAVGYFTEIHDCDDVYDDFPGGFDGGTLKDVKWWSADTNQDTYYKITLAE